MVVMAFLNYEPDEVTFSSLLLLAVKATAFPIVRAAFVSIYTLHGGTGMGSYIVTFSFHPFYKVDASN